MGPTGFDRAANTNMENRQAIDVNEAKTVNATASTNGAVKVTMGKSFRFGGKTVRVADAAVA